MPSSPCAACVALESRGTAQLHGDLRMTTAVVEIASRRRHSSTAYLCGVCGSRWDWSAALGWCRRHPASPA